MFSQVVRYAFDGWIRKRLLTANRLETPESSLQGKHDVIGLWHSMSDQTPVVVAVPQCIEEPVECDFAIPQADGDFVSIFRRAPAEMPWVVRQSPAWLDTTYAFDSSAANSSSRLQTPSPSESNASNT